MNNNFQVGDKVRVKPCDMTDNERLYFNGMESLQTALNDIDAVLLNKAKEIGLTSLPEGRSDLLALLFSPASPSPVEAREYWDSVYKYTLADKDFLVPAWVLDFADKYAANIKATPPASSGETMRWRNGSEGVPETNELFHLAHWRRVVDKVPLMPIGLNNSGAFIAQFGKVYDLIDVEFLDESASPSDIREDAIKPVSDYQELWDEFAEYVDDDIDSLSTFAGRTVLTDTNFKKLISRLPKTGKEEVLPFAEWVRTETVADGAPKLYHKGSGQRLTLSQLYDLYTQSLNK